MKKMSILLKILLSLVYLAAFFYGIIVYVLNQNFTFVNDTTHFVLMFLCLLIILFLSYRIYTYKTIEQKDKVLWIVLMFVFNPVIIYYIWILDNNFFNKELINKI